MKCDEGARYSQVHYGLLIRNITDADNGIYTCAAEVQSTGALSQRDIEVIVYCEFITRMQFMDLLKLLRTCTLFLSAVYG